MRYFFLFLSLLFLIACNNNARDSRSRKPAADAVYYDYQVWGEEGDSTVTVTFQYRNHGGDGQAQKLKDSGSVLLDGQQLQSDSSGYSGTIYSFTQPASAFAGQHTISFVDNNGKAHKEEFRFEPFALAEELPERLKKTPFSIKLKNFPAEPAMVRLTITDTSYSSRDVNDEMMIENGEIKISESQLANLVAGPVTLEIYREDEKPLAQTAKEGGRVLMMYVLRRELNLVE